MHPVCLLTVDGVPVSLAFMSRLISVTVTDKEGSSSDTIDLELEASGLALPRTGAIITCALGYAETGVSDFGTYTADDVTLDCLPYLIKIQGKSADMRASLKEHKSRHWDGQTFGGVVQQMAGEHGLAAMVDPSLASHKGKDGYFIQGGESDLHWIEHKARKLGGMMTVKNGRLIVAKKGSGMTGSGAAMGGLIVAPPMILQGTCSVKFGGREGCKEVQAAWHDPKEAKRKWEKAPVSIDGGAAEAVYKLRHDHTTQEDAQAAAESRAGDLKRSATQTSVTIEGNIAARGGAPMSYLGVHPQVDAIPFTIETAAHKYSKAGYTAAIDAKAKV